MIGRLDSSKKKKKDKVFIFKGGNGCHLADAARIFFTCLQVFLAVNQRHAHFGAGAHSSTGF